MPLDPNCPKCNERPRSVTHSYCVECRREYYTTRRLRNPVDAPELPCPRCKEGIRDGYKAYCKKCQVDYSRVHNRNNPVQSKAKRQRWIERNPEAHKKMCRKGSLKRLYNMTLEDYDRMFAEQGGLCKMCRLPETARKHLHVDHCHETNVVRGLLCTTCNTGIGSLRHSVTLLGRGIKYLQGSL
jgi:Autographiviridae endonuclease VII